MTKSKRRTARTVCALCEAGCGLLVELDGGRPVAVTGDPDDVTSQGYICPKGAELLRLEEDPDRLRQPMARTRSGDFEPISWHEALERSVEGITRLQRRYGKDSVAVHLGTVQVHKHGVVLMLDALKSVLDTRNWTGVSSQDTSARFVSAHHVYGSAFALAVPDIDRTDFFLCIGGNPLASNGSMMTAPNMKRRLRDVQRRGGEVVVVDPRRTETAQRADEHIAIRPGTDAALLLSMVQVLATDGRIDTAAVEKLADGWHEVVAKLGAFTPERVGPFCRVAPERIRSLARRFADAPSSVAYSRMGPGNARYATLTCYAIELLNLVAGRLGVEGGWMFPTPAIDTVRLARITGADGIGRRHSRVRGLPETVGELPATILAEEIETPGEGQVRGLLCFAANPVLASPNGRRLDRALARLDFMVAVDVYVNETTRHADIILPPASLLSEPHVDLYFAGFNVRNAMRWTEPVIPKGPDEKLDAEILLELVERLGGGLTAVAPVDAVIRALGYRPTPEHLASAALRLGPYGDLFGLRRDGLNAEKVKQTEGGIDLGPLQPGVSRRVFHPDGRLHLSSLPILDEIDRLDTAVAPPPAGEMLLIGRRHLRSNNSWMHNVQGLVSGRERSALLIHPDDAKRLGLERASEAWLSSKVHEGRVDIEVSDEVMPGVVSLPHGFGHQSVASWQRVAGALAGVSANDWTDDQAVENLAGQSILNGVVVDVRPVPEPQHQETDTTTS